VTRPDFILKVTVTSAVKELEVQFNFTIEPLAIRADGLSVSGVPRSGGNSHTFRSNCSLRDLI
jgi:hypothetical protein